VNGGEANGQRLEACCEWFEDHWNPELTVEAMLQPILEAIPPQDPIYYELFFEVALIDLENRWRHLADWLNRQTAVDEAMVQRARKLQPDWRVYLQLAPGADPEGTGWRRLAEWDLRCRFKYGDARIDRTVDWQPAEIEALRPLLPTVSVRDQRRLALYEPFHGPLVVGRQEKRPEPIRLVESEASKLICVPYRNTRVSRRQVLIEVLGGQWVCLSNTSRNRSVVVQKTERLAAGQSRTLRFPFAIRIDHLLLRGDRIHREATAHKPDEHGQA